MKKNLQGKRKLSDTIRFGEEMKNKKKMSKDQICSSVMWKRRVNKE
jgi:hypothetical protein